MSRFAFTKSIRWRLLAWLAVLLGFCLLALDFAAFEIHFSNQVGRLDEELRRRMAILSASLSGLGPMPAGARDGQPFPPPDNGPPSGEDLPFDLQQITAAVRQIEMADAYGSYFAIWIKDPAPFLQTTSPPVVLFRPRLRDRDTGTYTRTRDGFREVIHGTEHGDTLLIGRTLAPELAEARRLAGWLGLGSFVVLALGLGGAWLIIASALRPVEKISVAAGKIASGDLSQRINVADTDSELGQLANVLNSSFARLDAAFARQKQFTADAAHELRTPVTVLLTHAQNGLAVSCASPEHREAFEACQRAAQRMKKLIAALLSLARLDAARDPARWARFDLAVVVRESLDLLQPLAGGRRVQLSAELPVLEISGDAAQLAQVVTNLLANAIQYNRPGGSVELKLRREDNQAVLTVRDTGMGIPAEDLARVFERFYRADKSRSSGGLGLGLAIAKAIVSAHGGTIEVASQPTGSIFAVRLPIE